MSKKCILVGGGEFCREKFKVEKDVPVVAVDSGYEYVKDLVKPYLVVGDFDSLGYFPSGEKLVIRDPVKDFTDMYIAVEYMAERGYCEFEIYGGLGKRLDHTVANFQMARGFVEKGLKIKFIGSTEEVEFITDDFYARGEAGETFSLFAFGDCKGVTIQNAKYNLENASLSDSFPLGVSNEFIGEWCYIAVKEGVLIYIRLDKGVE
ncbi:MAG: thiamine diphosphokinase [Clostridia bacterium]|nr:thiamine diphosphokinase [Clostridia bacterium]MDE7328865.1 thiamine diphosphokinase [Clostridia bacterium]